MRRYFRRCCTALLLASCAFTITVSAAPKDDLWLYQVTHEEYEQIRELCADIMAKYPPDEYIYVGLGRSPTPLIAYFQEFLGKNHAMHVPLGGLQSTDAEDIWHHPATRGVLTKHFDTFFPKPKVINGRKVLVLDYASSGRSLKQSRLLLQKYLAAKGRAAQVTMNFLAFYGAPYPPATKLPEEIRALAGEDLARAQRSWIVDQPMNYRVPPELTDGTMDVMPAPEMLAKKMNLSLYEHQSEFNGHTIDSRPIDPTPRTKYKELRVKFKKWIREDTPLKAQTFRQKVAACDEIWRSTLRRFNSK